MRPGSSLECEALSHVTVTGERSRYDDELTSLYDQNLRMRVSLVVTGLFRSKGRLCREPLNFINCFGTCTSRCVTRLENLKPGYLLS